MKEREACLIIEVAKLLKINGQILEVKREKEVEIEALRKELSQV